MNRRPSLVSSATLNLAISLLISTAPAVARPTDTITIIKEINDFALTVQTGLDKAAIESNIVQLKDISRSLKAGWNDLLTRHNTQLLSPSLKLRLSLTTAQKNKYLEARQKTANALASALTTIKTKIKSLQEGNFKPQTPVISMPIVTPVPEQPIETKKQLDLDYEALTSELNVFDENLIDAREDINSGMVPIALEKLETTLKNKWNDLTTRHTTTLRTITNQIFIREYWKTYNKIANSLKLVLTKINDAKNKALQGEGKKIDIPSVVADLTQELTDFEQKTLQPVPSLIKQDLTITSENLLFLLGKLREAWNEIDKRHQADLRRIGDPDLSQIKPYLLIKEKVFKALQEAINALKTRIAELSL